MAAQIKKQTEDIEKVLARLGSGHNPKRPLTVHETARGLTACYLNALALLEDARLLAANGREPRALSLTILALEELAKVPDLYDHYVNPETRNDSNAWADLWKRWSRHQPKQERIGVYGNFLRNSAGLEKTVFQNPTPYATYFKENAYAHLDVLKQRNFYVDFIDSRFQRPEASQEICTVLDFLFSFVEERADSFGSWHVTPERSVDFLSVHLDGASESTARNSPTIGFNDWASTHEPIEAAADLLRLLCYHSSALVPNYVYFYPACEAFLSKKELSETVTLLRRVVSSLKRRMEVKALPTSGLRAFLMLKLLFSYATAHLSDAEREEVFPDVLSESSDV